MSEVGRSCREEGQLGVDATRGLASPPAGEGTNQGPEMGIVIPVAPVWTSLSRHGKPSRQPYVSQFSVGCLEMALVEPSGQQIFTSSCGLH